MKNFFMTALSTDCYLEDDAFYDFVKKAEVKLKNFYATHPNATRLNAVYNKESKIVTLSVFTGGEPEDCKYPKKVFFDCLMYGVDGEALSNRINAFYDECEKEGYMASKIQTVDIDDGVLYLIFADKLEEEADDEDTENEEANDSLKAEPDNELDKEIDDLFPLL